MSVILQVIPRQTQGVISIEIPPPMIIIIIIQFFIIYMPSQQPQGQLHTQHSVDTRNYIMDKHYIKSKTNYRETMEETTH
jgi:hypothetical protein